MSLFSKNRFVAFVAALGLLLASVSTLSAQHHENEKPHTTEHKTAPAPSTDEHAGHNHGTENPQPHPGDVVPAHGETATHGGNDACGHANHDEGVFKPGDAALHHIADANSIHIFGDIYVPLPCILYAPSQGLSTFMSSAFDAHHHGNGTKAIDNYVLMHGEVLRIADASFPKGEVPVSGFTTVQEDVNGKKRDVHYVCAQNKSYRLDKKTTYDGGVMGGGVTSYYDFSITKNVFTMILTFLILLFMLNAAAKAYSARPGQAPKGLQGFIEPLVVFIRDEVAKPNIGPKYEKFMPFLLSLFFFILGLNLIGQIPFFPGGANVTGNIAFTLCLAIFTFLMTLLNSNKHFWEHTLWMPGVPTVLKILVLTPIEVLGLFLKPFTLLLRLFANISAGHIVIICFVGLIFVFGKAGQSVGGSMIGIGASVPLTLFMMALELLVAFLQAFIFTMLTSTYIGAAMEEGHHHEEAHH